MPGCLQPIIPPSPKIPPKLPRALSSRSGAPSWLDMQCSLRCHSILLKPCRRSNVYFQEAVWPGATPCSAAALAQMRTGTQMPPPMGQARPHLGSRTESLETLLNSFSMTYHDQMGGGLDVSGLR